MVMSEIEEIVEGVVVESTVVVGILAEVDDQFWWY